MPSSGTRPPLRAALPASRRGWLLWLLVVAGIGLLSFSRYQLAAVAEGYGDRALSTFVDEMTAALGAGVLFFAVRWLARAYPLAGGGWRRHLPLYAAALALFSALHTSSNWLSRELLYRLVGLGDYDYGRMPVRYLMELPYDLLAFVVMVAVVAAVERLRAAREGELRAARLESSLARAELTNLRLQLQPHFLFNALNTISSTMYEDPAAADEMIDRLAVLLRASLATARADEVPLDDELGVLEAYVAVMKARFGDRLEVAVEAAPDVRRARVPTLLLQPLVENAVRHGGAERRGRGRIEVRAERRGRHLELSVADDGPGAPTPVDGGPGGAGTAPDDGAGTGAGGLGLAATAERLALLYGDDHRFAAGDRPGGGFLVTIRLPYRAAEDDAA